MKLLAQKHFDRISESYQSASDSWATLYEQIKNRINPLITGKVVLDVGNGSRFSYDVNLPSQIIATDISSEMLSKVNGPNIKSLVCDARSMKGIIDDSVDVVIFVLVLHHINGCSVRHSISTLDEVLSEAYVKLRNGGHLVVVEGLLSPALYRLQCCCFQLTHIFLRRFGVSMIFFFTKSLMMERIARVFHIEPRDIESVGLSVEGWLDPLGGSFPGLIKIPASIQPWDFRLMIVTKTVT